MSRPNKNLAARNIHLAKGMIKQLKFDRCDEKVSARLRRDIIKSLLLFVNGGTMSGFITHSKVISSMVDAVSHKQFERAFEALRNSGDIYTETIFGITPNGKHGVIGTKITLRCFRIMLKALLHGVKSVTDIFWAQLHISSKRLLKTVTINHKTVYDPSSGEILREYTERFPSVMTQKAV